MNKHSLTLRDDVKSAILHKESISHISPILQDSLKQFCASNCIHPRKVQIRDRFTHELKDIYVPCGHCHFCRSKKQGEWVSRMILQTLYCSKHCYFITLTYASFEYLSDVPKVLRDAYYRRDNFNYHHRDLYSPCLLRQEHVQRFMKYLRKFHGSDRISFFQGSEYGSDYGRPHHHLILWCDEPLNPEHVYHAWSFRRPHSNCTTLIGRVDFNDLMTNGTVINVDGINFGHDMHKCFAYVAKYLSKGFLDINDPIGSKSRLNLFIEDLSNRRISNTDINYVFDNRIKSLTDIFSDWCSYFADYVREKDYQVMTSLYSKDIQFLQKNEKLLRNIYYDYETSPIDFQLYRDDLVSQAELFEILQGWHPQISACVFRKVFKPYCLSSRSVGVGMEYLQANVERFVRGNFKLPQYDNKVLMFPTAFVRKTKEYLFRYSQTVQTYVSKSSASNLLINKNDFNAFLGDLSSLRFDLYSQSKILPSVDFGVSCNIEQLLRTDHAFTDYVSHTRCLVFIDPDYDISVVHYKFNRKSRLYDYDHTDTFSDFLTSLSNAYNRYKYLHLKLDKLQSDNMAIYEQYCEDIDLFCNSVLDCSSFDAIDFAYNNMLRELSDRIQHFDSLKPPIKEYMKQ